jgi:hypothetical protein
MTSWIRFLFHSSPWYARIFLAGTMPLWFSRRKKQWEIAAGWTLRYKKRPVVGVKPTRLLRPAQSKSDISVFVKEDDQGRMIQNVACHELVHAFTAHLKLPLWLNEGLAMVTVDKFAGKPTVNPETVKTLRKWAGKTSPGRYRKLDPGDMDALVYHFVRGYWITRYIEDQQPELLKDLLRRRYKKRELENKTAEAFGMTADEFWSKIDGMIAPRFIV